jgi:hypothetical protein
MTGMVDMSKVAIGQAPSHRKLIKEKEKKKTF